jgi:hypothetical protein
MDKQQEHRALTAYTAAHFGGQAIAGGSSGDTDSSRQQKLEAI